MTANGPPSYTDANSRPGALWAIVKHAMWQVELTIMATVKNNPKVDRTVPGGKYTSLGLAKHDVMALVKALKTGLPFFRLVAFTKKTGLTFAELAPILHIPPRTLARRKAQGALTGLESERLARLAGLVDQAVQLFEGDTPAAMTWLRTSAKALANHTPLLMAETEIGARAVEDLIGRLEFGVYA